MDRGSAMQRRNDRWDITPKAPVTPKALANLSPGFERKREPWDRYLKVNLTLKALGVCGNNPFRVQTEG